MKVKIYLAGPDVFLPEPIEAGERKKRIIKELCEKYKWNFNLEGHYPLDNGIENFGENKETAIRIFKANIKLMNNCNIICANLVPFRSPSMDVGTAFEMGYMFGLDKPVFGYYDMKPFFNLNLPVEKYNSRVKHSKYHNSKCPPNVDIDGHYIENFDMYDNLMIDGACEEFNHVCHTFEDAILNISEYVKKMLDKGKKI